MATDNNSIIQAAKLEATGAYFEFLDSISNQAPQEQAKALFDPYKGQWRNQFVDWLFNRVGRVYLKQASFEDPLAIFKKDNLPFGGAIQMSAVDFIKAQPFSDESDGDAATVPLLKVYRPKGKTAWAYVNTRRVTPVSYNETELQQAAAAPDGLARFISAIMEAPVASDNFQEYLLARDTIKTFDAAQPNTIYRAPAYSAAPTTRELATDFLTDLRTWANRLRFPTWVRQVTPGDMPGSYQDPSQLVLLLTPEVAANLDTRTLDALFHWKAPVSGAGTDEDPVKYRTVIVDDFGIDGCFAALVSEDTINIVDRLYQTSTFYSPASLTTSLYLHHQQYIYLNPFEPVILWGTGTNWDNSGRQTVTITQTTTGLALTATPSTIKAGETSVLTPKLQGSLAATPTGTSIDPDITVAPDSATYEVTAADSAGAAVTLNSRTYVDTLTNTLHTQKTLAAGTVLTVKATATYRNPDSETQTEYTANATVTIA